MSAYQATSTTIKYGDTNTEYVIDGKWKGVYVTELVAIKNDSLSDIRYFKHGIGIQFIVL